MTEGSTISIDKLQKYSLPDCNYGLRLDHTFEDGNFLASIDIEDVYPDVLLKYFTENLSLDPNTIPWTKTQSGAFHLNIKTDRQLRPVKILSGDADNDVIVELRTGAGQQNVIGPSVYKDNSTGELRPYITYGNLLEAPFVPSQLIINAFSELGGMVETPIKPKKQSETGINFQTSFDRELDCIYSAIELLRVNRISRDEWIECGFALIDRFGETAWPYFLHLSMNPNYPEVTYESIEQQFGNLLSTAKGVVTIGSLFHIAKQYGFEFHDDKMSEIVIQKPTTCISLDKELEEQFRFDDERDPNKLLGFPLTKFKELARNIDGLQAGFYLLGAESNVGKTAFLTNMTLDVMETNPDVSVIYFSLDDSRKYTGYRF